MAKAKELEIGPPAAAGLLPGDLLRFLQEADDNPAYPLCGDHDPETFVNKLWARACILTATDCDQIAGFIAVYCNDPITKRAFIPMIAVGSAYRRQGLGRALTSACLARVRQHGFEQCRLAVHLHNRSAQALYRSLGFTVVETREHFLVMDRHLGNCRAAV